MKKSDLYREWARVLDMCESKNAKQSFIWTCVRVDGIPINEEPRFIFHPSKYSFAIAILEGKPVFVGNRIWLVRQQFWTRAKTGHLINDDVCSWKEPKKTFMLNGVELPAATRSGGLNILEISDACIRNFFYFETEQDRNKVMEAIIKMLDDSTK